LFPMRAGEALGVIRWLVSHFPHSNGNRRNPSFGMIKIVEFNTSLFHLELLLLIFRTGK
jgi:hypothetical protein